jgi:hypothetical protein
MIMLKYLPMAPLCPKLFKHMPPAEKINDQGPWLACALRSNTFRGQREVYTKEVRGTLLKAYFVARILALKLDFNTPFADREIGVHWGVRKIES